MTGADGAVTPAQASFVARMTAYHGDSVVPPEVARNLWAGMSDAERVAEEAGAQAAIEAGPNAPERLAKGNTRLREENNGLRARLATVRQLAEQGIAAGLIESEQLLAAAGGAR